MARPSADAAGDLAAATDGAVKQPDMASGPSLTWHVEASGAPGAITCLWGTAASDVYAVNGGILHSVGDASWTAQPLPHADSTALCMWGTGRADVYAVGRDGYSGSAGAAIFHSIGDGTWSSEFSAAPSFAGQRFTGVWADTVGAMVVGDIGTVFVGSHAKGWSSADLNQGAQLNAVWGAAHDDVYAVADTAIFNGDTTGLYTTESNHGANAVWGSSATDVYAVSPKGVILHSTGNGAWTPQNSGTTNDLWAIWGSSSSDVYAVGAAGTIVHSTGHGDWSKLSGGTTNGLHAVWGSSSGDVYVAGDQGTILHGY